MPSDWAAAYAELIGRLPGFVEGARLSLCGFSVCVDAVVELGTAEALLQAEGATPAAALAAELKRRAANGIGGEIKVDWPAGPAWLERHLRFRTALGGTGAHAAWVLTSLGAPALLSLADRSGMQLAEIAPDVLLAEDGRMVRVRDVEPRGTPRTKMFIFEYTAGTAVGDIVPSRSSRIIVRFSDPGLEEDAAFVEVAAAAAGTAGAGILSGFNSATAASLPAAIALARRAASPWLAAGVPAVHLELADYPSPAQRDATLDGLKGAFNSIGMSRSEYLALGLHADDLAAGMVAGGQRLGVRRFCVHADHWAAAATLDDPARERDALLMGCLLASSRASAGRPVYPRAIARGAAFGRPPFDGTVKHGDWNSVCCVSPYLTRPATTLGAGDTFTAGCLLVLGQDRDEAQPGAVHPGEGRRGRASSLQATN